MEKRKIPEIVMDMLNDYAMVNTGKKSMLDYLDELMAAYDGMEKDYHELVLWQEEMKKDFIDLKKTLKELEKQNQEE